MEKSMRDPGEEQYRMHLADLVEMYALLMAVIGGAWTEHRHLIR